MISVLNLSDRLMNVCRLVVVDGGAGVVDTEDGAVVVVVVVACLYV